MYYPRDASRVCRIYRSSYTLESIVYNKTMKFVTDIKTHISKTENHICVGLDTDYNRIPEILKKNSSVEQTIFEFNKQIVDATHQYAAAYKSNMVFYGAYGIDGMKALLKTNQYIKKTYPYIKIVADAKRSEMGYTAECAAKEIFEEFLFDAMTVTPWFGQDTIEAYKKYENNAVFIFCHDSNPSAGDLQDLTLHTGEKLYQYLTTLVVQKWNTSGNILVEAPLTYPTILKEIYDLTDEKQFFLVAGLGAQGGSISDLSVFKERKNFIVNASRSIIFASTDVDFAEKARRKAEEYTKQIQDALK